MEGSYSALELLMYSCSTISKSVTKKLTHAVLGSDPGESKIEKLKENTKIKILNEDELFDLIRSLPAKEGSQVVVPKKSSKKVSPIKSLSQVYVHLLPLILLRSIPLSVDTKELTQIDASGKPVADMLWPDKYRPKSSRDLIGNAGSVQTLKKWLLAWEQNPSEKVKKGAERAVLISGPPGIGKTSSAVLAARECGYDTLEFNASDKRNKSAISVGDKKCHRNLPRASSRKQQKTDHLVNSFKRFVCLFSSQWTVGSVPRCKTEKSMHYNG